MQKIAKCVEYETELGVLEEPGVVNTWIPADCAAHYGVNHYII